MSGNLTPLQLAQLLQQAGFRGQELQDMVAIGLRESGGNPRAHNPTPPDNSYGLFQINMIGRLGPDRRQRYNLSSNEQLFDPMVNARVAFALRNDAGGLSPWKGPGPSAEHKRQAAEAIRQLGGAPALDLADTEGGESLWDQLTPDIISDPLDALGSVAEFAGSLTKWETWRRVLFVVGGIILLAIAAGIIVGDIAVDAVT